MLSEKMQCFAGEGPEFFLDDFGLAVPKLRVLMRIVERTCDVFDLDVHCVPQVYCFLLEVLPTPSASRLMSLCFGALAGTKL